jgi:hypothetical protein
MDEFWNQFLEDGARFGQTPTNGEYSDALVGALVRAGLTTDQAATVAGAAQRQREEHDLRHEEPVPSLARDTVQLWFRDTHVGTVHNSFCSDDVWFGTYTPTADVAATVRPRVDEYIAFCIDWHRRVDDKATEADEFDAYADVVHGRWTAKRADGTVMDLESAPTFPDPGRVSWRQRPSEPAKPKS